MQRKQNVIRVRNGSMETMVNAEFALSTQKQTQLQRKPNVTGVPRRLSHVSGVLQTANVSLAMMGVRKQTLHKPNVRGVQTERGQNLPAV